MKKILLLLTILLIFPISKSNAQVTPEEVSVVDTQTESVDSFERYFDLELTRESQSAINKSITYILTITPKIDSPKTQIVWDVPSTFKVTPKHNDFVNLSKDQTYTFKAVVFPKKEGTYDVTANVTSWQSKGNFTNSTSSTVELNKGLVVQPVDSGYTIGILLLVVSIIAASVIVLIVLKKSSSKILGRIKIWLTPPI